MGRSAEERICVHSLRTRRSYRADDDEGRAFVPGSSASVPAAPGRRDFPTHITLEGFSSKGMREFVEAFRSNLLAAGHWPTMTRSVDYSVASKSSFSILNRMAPITSTERESERA